MTNQLRCGAQTNGRRVNSRHGKKRQPSPRPPLPLRPPPLRPPPLLSLPLPLSGPVKLDREWEFVPPPDTFFTGMCCAALHLLRWSQSEMAIRWEDDREALSSVPWPQVKPSSTGVTTDDQGNTAKRFFLKYRTSQKFGYTWFFFIFNCFQHCRYWGHWIYDQDVEKEKR